MSSKITAKGIIAKVKDPVVAGKLTYKSITAQIEGFTKLEILPIDLSKSFIDYNNTSSEIYFDAQFQRVSTRFTSEFISKEAANGIVNTKSTSSVFSRVVTYNRPDISDLTSATENLNVFITKGFLNNIDQIEIFEVNLNKIQLDELSFSELFTLNINPVYIDNVSISSDNPLFFVFKQLEEVVDATDDVFGEATIDDDQYAFVTKVLHNNMSYADEVIIEIGYIRDYEDQFTSDDSIIVSVNTSLGSSFSTNSSVLFEAEYFRDYESNLTHTDLINISTNTALSSSFITESDITFELDYNRAYEEQFNYNDVVSVSVDTPLSSSFSTNINVILETTKGVALEAVTSESLQKYISDYFAEDYSLEGYAGNLIVET